MDLKKKVPELHRDIHPLRTSLSTIGATAASERGVDFKLVINYTVAIFTTLRTLGYRSAALKAPVNMSPLAPNIAIL